MASFEQMLKDSEARIMASIGKLETQVEKLEGKIDEASDFQSGLQGAAKIGMAIVLILGTIVAIYAGLHGLHPGASK